MARLPDPSRASASRRETGALLRLFQVLVEVADRTRAEPDAAGARPTGDCTQGREA